MSLPWMHLLRHLLDGMEAERPADDDSGVKDRIVWASGNVDSMGDGVTRQPHPRQAITDAPEEELEL